MLRGIRPRRVNESLQGQILQELLESSKSTSELAFAAREDLASVRREVISLHHIGAIEPVGIRMDSGICGAKLYYRDYLWSITDHGMSHSMSTPGCTACYLRERTIILAGGL